MVKADKEEEEIKEKEAEYRKKDEERKKLSVCRLS